MLSKSSDLKKVKVHLFEHRKKYFLWRTKKHIYAQESEVELTPTCKNFFSSIRICQVTIHFSKCNKHQIVNFKLGYKKLSEHDGGGGVLESSLCDFVCNLDFYGQTSQRYYRQY